MPKLSIMSVKGTTILWSYDVEVLIPCIQPSFADVDGDMVNLMHLRGGGFGSYG
jgi:hypothetical protein